MEQLTKLLRAIQVLEDMANDRRIRMFEAANEAELSDLRAQRRYFVAVIIVSYEDLLKIAQQKPADVIEKFGHRVIDTLRQQLAENRVLHAHLGHAYSH